jgi:hypothetical protein
MAPSTRSQQDPEESQFAGLDLRDIWSRTARGFAQIVGLGLLGLATAGIIYFIGYPLQTLTTTTNVVFSFPNLEKGQYPDESKFQPDDLRAPEIVASALERLGLDNSSDYQSKIRGALSVEGIISPEIIKTRERLRAEGQTLPPYISDEYIVSLTLPRKFKLAPKERILLLNAIVTGYDEKFQRTFATVPAAFGNVFDSLRGSDYTDYELILTKEIQNITDYLTRQRNRSPAFRSVTTNLSFGDLLEQTQLFTQVNLDETLGQIYFQGLSRNREAALAKIDYYLHTLDGLENRAASEEKVVLDLLNQYQSRSENYVLGIKSASTETPSRAPILDQGLIDSLLANDANGYLVRRALDAGMKVKDIQSEKFQLLERKKKLESFTEETGTAGNQGELAARVDKSLGTLKVQYSVLISNIQKTNSDYGRQEYADAMRVSKEATTESPIVGLGVYAASGVAIGLVIGTGLSLLEIYVGASRRSA